MPDSPLTLTAEPRLNAAPNPSREREADGRPFVAPWVQECLSWVASMLFHTVLLLALALWTIPEEVRGLLGEALVHTQVEQEKELEEIVTETIDLLNVDLAAIGSIAPPSETLSIPKKVGISPAEDTESVSVQLSPFADRLVTKSELLTYVEARAGVNLSGRGMDTRSGLLHKGGGNGASEKAVQLALAWLAAHQLPDGGWDLNHAIGPGLRSQRNPGVKLDSRNGATALALLPFLGAGQTHRDGLYKQTVEAGLEYLIRNIKRSQLGGMLADDGSMYAHGLGAIVLCESYAMTQDSRLADPAQATLNFIVSSQDPRGGGWRYVPRTPGDTSVVGWQIMALKSGHLAHLSVPGVTIARASHFLDSVQTDGGAAYGYVSPGAGKATSAVGLLCRMFMGWKRDAPALKRGVKWIAKMGPSPDNYYFNYYAMQVMFQSSKGGQGRAWKIWNKKLRDQLVETQDTEGAERGSWFSFGGHGKVGGRLYCTAMGAMTLEVYYRHMPIYARESTEIDFPD